MIVLVDEAEGVIVMISEWLELDAADDWVRHDAEIVRLPHRPPLAYMRISFMQHRR